MRNREGRQTGQVWKVDLQSPASDGDVTYKAFLADILRGRGLRVERIAKDGTWPSGYVDAVSVFSFVIQICPWHLALSYFFLKIG
jgi:hypothetical protein